MKKRMGICWLVVLLFSLSVLCGGCQWISPLPEESSAPEVSLTEAGLAPFKVLFVGASHCMTDAQVAAVRSFAERGGTVRVSTLAGMCDEFGDRRSKWPFADVFGFEPRIDRASGNL